MTTPKKPRRDYRDAAGNKLPGVTTIISAHLGWSTNPLMWWTAGQAAAATASAILDGGQPREAAVELGRKAHMSKRDAAANAGTRAHALVEAHLAGEQPEPSTLPEDDEVLALRAASRVIAWLRDHVDVVASERAMVSDALGFGGTLDLVVRDRATGELLIADIKTSKSAHDEVIVQLAAYAHLWDTTEAAIRNPMIEDIEKIAGGIVINSPLVDDLKIHRVTAEQLRAGQVAFTSLLWLHKHRKTLTLGDPGVTT